MSSFKIRDAFGFVLSVFLTRFYFSSTVFCFLGTLFFYFTNVFIMYLNLCLSYIIIFVLLYLGIPFYI